MSRTQIDPETQRQIDSWTKPEIPKAKRPGRPKKGEVRPVKRMGRPPGQRASQLELQEYLYSHPDKLKAVEMLFSITEEIQSGSSRSVHPSPSSTLQEP